MFLKSGLSRFLDDSEQVKVEDANTNEDSPSEMAEPKQRKWEIVFFVCCFKYLNVLYYL